MLALRAISRADGDVDVSADRLEKASICMS